MIIAHLALGLSIGTVTIAMAMLAQYGNERMFLIHLGRRMNGIDLAWVRCTRLLIIGCGLFALVSVLTSPSAHAATLVLFSSMIQLLAIGVGTLRAIITSQVPSPAQRYAVPLDAPFRAKDLASPFWQATNLCLFVVATSVFMALKEQLPAEIPLQFGWNGEVRRMGRPSELWLSAYLIAFHTASMIGLFFALCHERVALSAKAPDTHLGLHRTRRLLLARLLEAIFIGSNAVIASGWIALTLHGLPEPRLSVSAVLLINGIGATIVVIAPLLYFIRPLIKVQDQLRTIGGSHVLGTRADGWIAFGLFYYAPEDPAVFVPKKHGIGQTLNLARPAAWFLIAALVLPPVLLTWLVLK